MNVASVSATISMALAVGIVLVNAGNFPGHTWKLPVEAASVGALFAVVACSIEVLIRQGRDRACKLILQPRDRFHPGKLPVG